MTNESLPFKTADLKPSIFRSLADAVLGVLGIGVSRVSESEPE